jgi:hypothetical protein
MSREALRRSSSRLDAGTRVRLRGGLPMTRLVSDSGYVVRRDIWDGYVVVRLDQPALVTDADGETALGEIAVASDNLVVMAVDGAGQGATSAIAASMTDLFESAVLFDRWGLARAGSGDLPSAVALIVNGPDSAVAQVVADARDGAAGRTSIALQFLRFAPAGTNLAVIWFDVIEPRRVQFHLVLDLSLHRDLLEALVRTRAVYMTVVDERLGPAPIGGVIFSITDAMARLLQLALTSALDRWNVPRPLVAETIPQSADIPPAALQMVA